MQNSRRFTLVEVVVAVAVLGIAMASIVTMVSQASNRFMRAEQGWAREHTLTNATEWYLLAGPDAPLPEGLLPRGFAAECSLQAVEDLPDMAATPLHGWLPARYSVKVANADNQQIGSREVIKMVPENEL